jgi:predicted dithiol-disulfide oxidoreductase (DUF899 family)
MPTGGNRLRRDAFDAQEENDMSELKYPNETREYRDARDALLKAEQELVDKTRAVAALRRNCRAADA